MGLPSFSADQSLYKSRRRYRSIAGGRAGAADAIMPASVCNGPHCSCTRDGGDCLDCHMSGKCEGHCVCDQYSCLCQSDPLSYP